MGDPRAVEGLLDATVPCLDDLGGNGADKRVECEKLVKIGAKVVSHGRYVTFQMAVVAVPRHMFADILSLIARLRAPPTPA